MAKSKEKPPEVTLEAQEITGKGGAILVQDAFQTGEPFMAHGLNPHGVRVLDLQQTVENMMRSPTPEEEERFRRYGIVDPNQRRLYYAQAVAYGAKEHGISIKYGIYNQAELDGLPNPTLAAQPGPDKKSKRRKLF